VEPALHAHLIDAVPGHIGRYRFSHVLLRDCVYDDLPSAERIDLHLRIGEALETLYSGRVGPRTAELAYHFFEAVPIAGFERAIAYSLHAARWADSRLAYEDVPRHYRRALRLLDQKTPSDALEYGNLLLTLGEAEIRAGERDEAQETFKEAVRIARETNAPELLAQAALGLAPGFFAIEVGVYDPYLVSILKEALESIPTGDSPLRSQLLARLSTALVWHPGHAFRISLSNESLRIARSVKNPYAVAKALFSYHGCLWRPDQIAQRKALLGELNEITLAAADIELRLMCKLLLITQSLELSSIEIVQNEISEFRSLAKQTRRPGLIWYAQLFDAMIATLRGKFSDAAVAAQEFRRTGERARDKNVIHAFATQNAILAYETGRSAEIIPAIRALIAEYPAVTGWRCTLAYLLAEIGDIEAARHEFEFLARHDFSDFNHRETDAISLNLLATTCSRLGDQPRAKRLYDLLLPASRLSTVIAYAVAYHGPVADRLGQLSSVLGDPVAANEHFQHAIQSCHAIDSPPWLARVQYHFSEAKLQMNKPSERIQAELLLEQSKATASRLGMTQLLNQISDFPANAKRD
jgi:tetratricopeptide (TPR) repeat protein